eukprot:scaffold1424_cov168-Amphora_coffeaeformis.AAC.17
MNVRQGSLTENQGVNVRHLDEFVTNFNKEHATILRPLRSVLREELVIITGGAVLRAFKVKDSLRPDEWWENGKRGIDIFIYGRVLDQRTSATRRKRFIENAEESLD